ncbi:cell division protein ZipA [Aliivibrio sp. S4TY2]|uniref:cell division protein ZipA n=1 Tax=unclassified Aliivibrio TaxID=2645654 RepID=UPI002379154A|nr:MULTISPECIES: cell division protein ZipA [unclassified Aliivibrio]MDD9154820.1 cell division protein ZipA [Aliivibrio sp. S4TY2]MDD9158817.1 cell division protein ZipA [Aliivibrio sp. S4TY1]MDD9162823.1 cell division protein ZipA [Aliivibrio sp. S4MY2]MDD9166816.1 cell division protein ZipA [Aliivibrio sp. S4MY4]MDD9183900.1 cell division protein ZipA [Aliivibrio sp. S4MY3]
MQELRLVLILVGALAIAALLFHGLWTSRKETNSKFGKKVDIDFDIDEEQPTPERSFAKSKDDIAAPKERKEPAFAREEPAFSNDPLFDYEEQIIESNKPESISESFIDEPVVQTSNKVIDEPTVKEEPTISFSAIDDAVVAPKEEPQIISQPEEVTVVVPEPIIEPIQEPIQEPEPEPEVKEDAIIINVHGMGSERFNGSRLFNSLEQNGLVFGDMAIYHRHSDLSGAGKVLFSVANMVSPGHFQVSEGEEFSTPGISFFLPLPCHGEAEHNFKLMLQTAQLVSSELGGNILDEKRDMLTPNKIDEYKQRVKVFCRK